MELVNHQPLKLNRIDKHQQSQQESLPKKYSLKSITKMNLVILLQLQPISNTDQILSNIKNISYNSNFHKIKKVMI